MADQDSNIPNGFCQCGCGTKVSKRFAKGHNKHIQIQGDKNPKWNGGKSPYRRGRGSNRYQAEHRVIAEKALGKRLPIGSEIHHYTPDQVVVCQDRAYHFLLHQRQRAYEACGNPSWRKCKFCKQYDSPDNLFLKKSNAYHRKCHADFERQRRIRKSKSTPAST